MPGLVRDPYLVAECGVNWNSLSIACNMIRKAKDAGFDAAKFQLYDQRVIAKSPENVRAALEERRLTLSDARVLYGMGRQVGIPVFFTAMSTRAVKIVQKLGCDMVKIRLLDSDNKMLMNDARAACRIIMFSTANPQTKRPKNCIPLFCVPKYPAAALDYEAFFGAPEGMGVSLHAPFRHLFRRLWYAGASVIEMHVCNDGDSECLDAAVSVPFGEASKWIKECRNADPAVDGQPADEPHVLRQPATDHREAAAPPKAD